MMLKWDHLVGRPFEYGVKDCLALFRQFYADNFDIHITDYARPTNWASDSLDLITKCYEREGFNKITDWKAEELRPGDVLCMAIGESNPNHFSVYVGDNSITIQKSRSSCNKVPVEQTAKVA